ncbi:hypothetical protein L1887_30231 [Cichorium endivia]|nr:hypothetical protein L1887_30231 [Cichorium endivia]
MAKTPLSLLPLLLIFHILIVVAVSWPVFPDKKPKKPDWLIDHDRGYLIPGIGQGVRNVALRKLLNDLGITAKNVPVDEFTPLGRILYKAA